MWESYKLDPYVQRLADTIFNFQEKVSVSNKLTNHYVGSLLIII